MALINAFLRQTVSLKRFIGLRDGAPAYDTPEEIKCRFERGHFLRSVATFSSGIVDEVPAGARMYCTGDDIPKRSVVVYNGKEYIVTNCKVLNGFNDDHLEVLLS